MTTADRRARAASAASPPPMPFAAIVGHAWAKTAMLLLAIEPRLGGVLIGAAAGTGKSALIRSFHALLPPIAVNAGCPLHCDPSERGAWCGDCLRDPERSARVRSVAPPLVDVPLSVTEDRLAGGLELEASLQIGRPVAAHGLLALANRGVLAVESLNLLDMRPANLILEAMGRRRAVIEREGISRDDPAAFSLIGAYDPAEGALRPHLADRIGLIVAPQQALPPEGRALVVRRSERARRAPLALSAEFLDEMDLLRALLADARERLPTVVLDDGRAEALVATAIACGVEGNRADLFAVLAARAAAALAGRDRVDDDDLRVAVQLVLLPRATRIPEPPPQPPAPPDPPPDAADERDRDDQREAEARPPGAEALVMDALQGVPLPGDLLVLAAARRRRAASGSRGATESPWRGRVIGVRPGDPREGRISVAATLRAAAPMQRGRGWVTGDRPRIAAEDIRIKRYRDKAGTLFIFCVDASGSMALNRMRQAKGAVTQLLAEAYVHRDRVAMIAFRGARADLLLPPSQGVERARRALDLLPTGGGTPLASALQMALDLAGRARETGVVNVMLVCITDARANVPLVDADGAAAPVVRRAQAQAEVGALARRWRVAGWRAVVIDTQAGFTGRGEAPTLAKDLGGRYLYLPGARARDIAAAVAGAADEVRSRR